MRLSRLSILASLVLPLALVFGCEDDGGRTGGSPDESSLSGVRVTDPVSGSPYSKLFVLNEGQMGKNNASVDFLRFSDGVYVTSVFRKINPTIPLGLGDTANDIKVGGDIIWVAETGSGIVETFRGTDQKHLRSYDIPAARQISLSADYAFVSSFSGAVYGGNDMTGRLYRISLSDGCVTNTDVGYQPEGVLVDRGGELVYVANSGGYRPQYDSRLSVIRTSDMSLVKNIEVAKNLKDIYQSPDGLLWITALGDYSAVHSGMYCIDPESGEAVAVEGLNTVRVGASCMADGKIYVIGSDDEWKWDETHSNNLYIIDTSDRSVRVVPFEGTDLVKIGTPYAILVNPHTSEIYVTDAADYVNPGKVYCLDGSFRIKWSAQAGVNPGHMSLFRTK